MESVIVMSKGAASSCKSEFLFAILNPLDSSALPGSALHVVGLGSEYSVREPERPDEDEEEERTISIGGASSRIIPAERNPVERRIWRGVRDLEEEKELMMLLRFRRSVLSGTGGVFRGMSSKEEVLEAPDGVRRC